MPIELQELFRICLASANRARLRAMFETDAASSAEWHASAERWWSICRQLCALGESP
jgi:hypothetical protein